MERLENIKELATLALKYDSLENGTGVEKLLEDASLASDQDSLMLTEEKKQTKPVAKIIECCVLSLSLSHNKRTKRVESLIGFDGD